MTHSRHLLPGWALLLALLLLPSPAPAAEADDWVKEGRKYYDGQGVTRDYTEAVRWFRKAAEAGSAEGMNLLGICFRSGRGVEKDSAEGARWYRKAADLGYAVAQSNLGVCLLHGLGVEKNHAEAVELLRKAVAQDHVLARHWLGECYLNGWGVPKNEELANAWWQAAADRENGLAMRRLGESYAIGRGGFAQDQEQAIKWMRHSAKTGNETAAKWLKENGAEQRPAPAPAVIASQQESKPLASANPFGPRPSPSTASAPEGSPKAQINPFGPRPDASESKATSASATASANPFGPRPTAGTDANPFGSRPSPAATPAPTLSASSPASAPPPPRQVAAAPAAPREHTYYTYFWASTLVSQGDDYHVLKAFTPVLAFKDAPQKYAANEWAYLTPDDSERFAQVRAKWQAAIQTALQREARRQFGASIGQVNAKPPLGPPSSEPHEQQFLRRQPFQPREGREILGGGNEGEILPSRADADYVRNVHKLMAENSANQSYKVHVIEVDESGRSTPWPYSRNAVAHAGNAGAVEMAGSGGGGAAEGGVQGLLRQFSALAQVSAEGSDAMAGYWKSTTGREQYFIMGGSTGYNISPTYVDGAHSVIMVLPIAYSYDSGANVWAYRMTEGAYAIGSKEPVNRSSTQTYRVQPQWIGGGRSAFQVNQLRLEKISAAEWAQTHKEMLDRQLRLNGLNPIEFNNVKAGGGQPVRGSAPGSFQRK